MTWPVAAPTGCDGRAVIEVKQGDAYNLPVFILNPATNAQQSTVGCVVRSIIKAESGAIVSNLPMVVIDASIGAYAIPFQGTAIWPIGDSQADIEVTWPDGVVEHSATFIVRVLASQTL